MATRKRKSTRNTTAKKQAGGLYQTTSRSARNYKPRYYTVLQDTPKAISTYDREDYIKLARELFTRCPDLGGALIQKTAWVVGPGSFRPIYTGENEAWGDAAEQWLVDSYYPACSVLGPNYPFESLLNVSSLALDVDGESGLYLTTSKGGFPQVGLLPAHRIGQRNPIDKEVKSGPFKGYTITDGVILNDNGRAIGYRILGDALDGSQDYDVSTQNFQLLFEPEWCDQLRGISKVARSVTDWSSQDEINEFLLRGVKLASSIGLIHKTESGGGEDSAFAPGSEEDEMATSGVQVTTIQGGEIVFMKAAANESLEALKNENPSQNTEDFVSRIQKRSMYSIGWPQELLDPSKIGGASVRLIQDLVRKTVAARQAIIERRARLIVNYGIAKAMKEEFLPRNDKDWYKWSFTKGSQIQVDSGNEQAASREGYKLGITTLAEISSQKGMDWYELRNQQDKELKDLLLRAQKFSKEFGITMEAALSLLNQRSANPVIVADTTNNSQ